MIIASYLPLTDWVNNKINEQANLKEKGSSIECVSWSDDSIIISAWVHGYVLFKGGHHPIAQQIASTDGLLLRIN